MTDKQPSHADNLTHQYDDGKLQVTDKSQTIPWEEGLQRLSASDSYWFATVHPDGRPHVRPVLAVWHDGAMYSTTNPTTRKGRNLEQDSRFALTARSEDIDIVVEGRASRVTDETLLQAVADIYIKQHGWNVTVKDMAFDAPYGAPAAGPPPYYVYKLQPEVIFGFGTTEKFASKTTRWRFSS